jgi:hypothetical protein
MHVEQQKRRLPLSQKLSQCWAFNASHDISLHAQRIAAATSLNDLHADAYLR